MRNRSEYWFGFLSFIFGTVGFFMMTDASPLDSSIYGNTDFALTKADRHLASSIPGGSCSRLQHEVQRALMTHDWSLSKLKFQQRLKRHPQYIVTIQSVRSQQAPLIELRCPSANQGLTGKPGVSALAQLAAIATTSATPSPTINSAYQFLFHEARFTADSVRLFDIASIFPIHAGSLSIKLKLDPLIIVLDNDVMSPSIKSIGYVLDSSEESNAKEHREDNDSLLDLEKEIESVFRNRIQPDVQKQIQNVVNRTVSRFLQTQREQQQFLY